MAWTPTDRAGDQYRHTTTRTLLTGLAGVLALPLVACVAENDRLTLGHEVNLPALSPEGPGVLDDQPEPMLASATRGTPEGPRSVIGVDRGNWSSTTFLVPVDGTGHRPTYAVSLQLKDATARQRGEYPTAYSALQLDGGFTDEQLVESIDSPILVLGGAIIVPFRLFFEPQCRVDWSPAWSYARVAGGKAPATAIHYSDPRSTEQGTQPAPTVPTSTNPNSPSEPAQQSDAQPEAQPATEPAAEQPAPAPAETQTSPTEPAPKEENHR